MIVHGDRHLPRVQRPHTRCHPCTRSLTHTPCLIRTHHTTHTHGGTHPRCFNHTGVRTHVPPFARTWFLPPAVPLSHTACREARTPAHSRPQHSHTGAHSRARPHSETHSGSHPHTGSHSHSRLLAHNAFPALLHSRHVCVAARISTHWCIRTATPHTPGPHSQPHTRGHSHLGSLSHHSPHTPGLSH